MVIINSEFWLKRQTMRGLTRKEKLLKDLQKSEDTYQLIEKAVEVSPNRKNETLEALVAFLCFQKHFLEKHKETLTEILIQWEKHKHPQRQQLKTFLNRENQFFKPRKEKELPSKYSVRVRMLHQNKTFTVYEWEDIFSIDTHTYSMACISPRVFVLAQINMLRIVRDHIA